jgi:periplasmic protein TonB
MQAAKYFCYALAALTVLAGCATDRPPARTPVRLDPKYPFIVDENSYPIESRRNGEQGTCRVQVTISKEGYIVNAEIESSSGYTRLDAACIWAMSGKRMIPATENGKPIQSHAVFPITWTLRTSAPAIQIKPK